MIELTQIKATDALWQLRGQLNTAFTEIQTDQPFVGLCNSISINAYNKGSLTAAITASSLSASRLYALCFPESNGVFVAKVFGRIQFSFSTTTEFNTLTIDVPSIKLPTRDASVSTFVSPAHLGLGTLGSDYIYTGAALYAEQDATQATPLSVNILEKDGTCDVTLSSHNLEAITNEATGVVTLYL